MKVGDLIRVTTECFVTNCIGEIGIITHIRDYGHYPNGAKCLDVTILFSVGECVMDPCDIEVISESGRLSKSIRKSLE